ncbi:MAG: hypothetical protein ACI9LO_002640 [Planctomycetota bacterium]|jgi:hypothetical protein
MRHDNRRALQASDHICRSECFARPGHPEQRLVHQSVFDSLYQPCDRLGLISGGHIIGDQLEFFTHKSILLSIEQTVLYSRIWLRILRLIPTFQPIGLTSVQRFIEARLCD